MENRDYVKELSELRRKIELAIKKDSVDKDAMADGMMETGKVIKDFFNDIAEGPKPYLEVIISHMAALCLTMKKNFPDSWERVLDLADVFGICGITITSKIE